MVERAKKAIVELLIATKEITEGEAWDIVNETQSVVNDTLAGETYYDTPDEVVFDYLGLCQDYTWVFLYDDKDNQPVEIPTFHGMLKSLEKISLFNKTEK